MVCICLLEPNTPSTQNRDCIVKGRYHVDVFVDIEKITIDEDVVYRDGEFNV